MTNGMIPADKGRGYPDSPGHISDDSFIDPDMDAPSSPITAQHFLPDRPAWNAKADLSARVHEGVTVPIAPKININYMDEISPGETRPNFGFLVADWYHYDLCGILTEEIWQTELDEGIAKFIEQLNHLGKIEPVRIYLEPGTKYGVAYHDWRGDEYPIDIRAFIIFGAWEEPATKQPSAGLHFCITTLVKYDTQAEVDAPIDDAGPGSDSIDGGT